MAGNPTSFLVAVLNRRTGHGEPRQGQAWHYWEDASRANIHPTSSPTDLNSPSLAFPGGQGHPPLAWACAPCGQAVDMPTPPHLLLSQANLGAGTGQGPPPVTSGQLGLWEGGVATTLMAMPVPTPP